ncbi:hypothetical protein NX059_006863 [Plenodomus lindquistii]|nr:hypothetical protein NX059_006863 [Plenodomus lindquistii]
MPSQRRQRQVDAADDDWRQKEDIDERRRVQNRLSQRKRRNQLKTAEDTGTGYGQKFMFVEPNAVTLPRVKAPHRQHTTPQAAPFPKEGIRSLGKDPTMDMAHIEQPVQADWDVENPSGFDAPVMDFDNMLWDVNMYDNAEGMKPLSTSNTPAPHFTSALLGSCGSDITLDPISDPLAPAPPVQISNDRRIEKPATRQQVNNPMENFAGYAALHLAAHQGRLAIIKLLVEKGQPIDQMSDNCHTALSLALEGDHIEVMQYLLEQGAFPDALNGDGSTVLHLAARRGQSRATELLLDYMENPNVIDRNGCSALHIAVAEGQTDVVRVILERGVDTQLKIAMVDT